VSYQFPPEIAKLLADQLAAGHYLSEDAVLLDALHALVAQRSAEMAFDYEVIEGVRRGLDDVQAGRLRPFAEFDSELRGRRQSP